VNGCEVYGKVTHDARGDKNVRFDADFEIVMRVEIGRRRAIRQNDERN
jgi:hypothetical protein